MSVFIQFTEALKVLKVMSSAFLLSKQRHHDAEIHAGGEDDRSEFDLL